MWLPDKRWKCNRCSLETPIPVSKAPKCLRCVGNPGLGDWVEKKLKRIGIKTCGGCEQRKELLNIVSDKIKELTYG